MLCNERIPVAPHCAFPEMVPKLALYTINRPAALIVSGSSASSSDSSSSWAASVPAGAEDELGPAGAEDELGP